jgi:hypothetical protein
MAFNERDYRPITFEGVVLPPSVMGMTILMDLPGATEELLDWIWKFPHCKGITKSSAADICHRSASLARDLLLEQRQLVLKEIAERLGPHGFDAQTTFGEWVTAFQTIADISKKSSRMCQWSAPLHPDDRSKTREDAQRFLDALERNRPDLPEGGP